MPDQCQEIEIHFLSCSLATRPSAFPFTSWDRPYVGKNLYLIQRSWCHRAHCSVYQSHPGISIKNKKQEVLGMEKAAYWNFKHTVTRMLPEIPRSYSECKLKLLPFSESRTMCYKMSIKELVWKCTLCWESWFQNMWPRDNALQRTLIRCDFPASILGSLCIKPF